MFFRRAVIAVAIASSLYCGCNALPVLHEQQSIDSAPYRTLIADIAETLIKSELDDAQMKEIHCVMFTQNQHQAIEQYVKQRSMSYYWDKSHKVFDPPSKFPDRFAGEKYVVRIDSKCGNNSDLGLIRRIRYLYHNITRLTVPMLSDAMSIEFTQYDAVSHITIGLIREAPHNQYAIYYQRDYGGQGWGNDIFVERDGTSWKIKHKQLLWTS